jgi:type II secretory ATPase GspE/PulE/Tfp pilus assembly ATPase PilB-like protein
MKAEPFLVSSTINVIIAQRLVRKLCEGKEKYNLKESEIKDLRKYCDLDKILGILHEEKLIDPKKTFKDIDFYKPKSSKENKGGYKGRVGIYEVLPVTEAIRDLIVKKADADQIQKKGQEEGMRTIIEDGFIKAVEGVTSIEEVLRVIAE